MVSSRSGKICGNRAAGIDAVKLAYLFAFPECPQRHQRQIKIENAPYAGHHDYVAQDGFGKPFDICQDYCGQIDGNDQKKWCRQRAEVILVIRQSLGGDLE